MFYHFRLSFPLQTGCIFLVLHILSNFGFYPEHSGFHAVEIPNCWYIPPKNVAVFFLSRQSDSDCHLWLACGCGQPILRAVFDPYWAFQVFPRHAWSMGLTRHMDEVYTQNLGIPFSSSLLS